MVKKLVLMKGLPGSGKSTLAKKLAEENNGVIYSTDNYFMVAGQYKFNGSLLGQAHDWNRISVLQALIHGKNYVIVDNTNCSYFEIEPYVKMALQYNYEIEIVEPDNPDRFDVDLCTSRNTHGVPREAIERMLGRWESTKSFYDKIDIAKFIKHTDSIKE